MILDFIIFWIARAVGEFFGGLFMVFAVALIFAVLAGAVWLFGWIKSKINGSGP